MVTLPIRIGLKWNEEVRFPVAPRLEMEAARQYSHDHEGTAIQVKRLPEDGPVPREMARPESVRDNSHVWVVILRNPPAHARLDAERFQEPR